MSRREEPLTQKTNITYSQLEAVRSSISSGFASLSSKKEELSKLSQQVSYRKLYEAVAQLQQSHSDHCPACGTKLDKTALNPYEHAKYKLKELDHLADLQSSVEEIEDENQTELLQLMQILNLCSECFPMDGVLQSYKLTTVRQATESWWNSFFQEIIGEITPWQHLMTLLKKVEASDRQIDQQIELRDQKWKELQRLRDFAKEVTVMKTRRKTAESALEKAQKLINNFGTENSQLKTDVEVEKGVVLRNTEIASSYSTFVEKLNQYNNNLPSQLLTDLGETIVDLYNAINRSDSPRELLANVKLPLRQNQRLEISFQRRPERFYDALHVLSEGHIRCIGLAILLAKNLKENCPLLIFDDPVNAIDDEHRESIRRTIFEGTYFTDRQIILTCHGEEFFKDIHNLLSVEAARQAHSFSFLPRLEESHIQIDFNCAPRNYILAAREHFNRSEIRDSLAKARRALESLTKNKVWKYVTKYGDGNLSIKLRSFSSAIELRNLTDQLRSKVRKDAFADPEKERVLDPLNTLLGLNGDSREWRYLNKGTHEDTNRGEFDWGTVRLIITCLEQLDAALI